MFDKELFRKEFYDGNHPVIFSKRSVSGKVIFVAGKGFHYDFDENNEEQMKMLAEVLDLLFETFVDDIKTSQEEQKLEDFNHLMKILNNYRYID